MYYKCTPAAYRAGMATTRARVTELLNYARARHGLPYAYGGSFSTNPKDSTDCSGVVFSAAAILNGQSPNRRYGSTETARIARMNGVPAPCGIMPASSAAAIPNDAVLKIGFQHGGGGADSHTACTFFVDGKAYSFESRGWPGVLLTSPGSTARNPSNDQARAWNSALFHDFWYYPGPVDGKLDPYAFPLPVTDNGFYYYGPYEGPAESISGRAGEPAEWIDGLRRWQKAAGVEADGIYGAATKRRATELQVPAGLMPDGLIGPKTWALAFKSGGTNPVDTTEANQLYTRLTEFMVGFMSPAFQDIKDIRQQLTGGRDTVFNADGSVDLVASYPGLQFLGNGTVPDALARIGEALKLPGFYNPKP